jgi:lysophospholipase L1-like esterase
MGRRNHTQAVLILAVALGCKSSSGTWREQRRVALEEEEPEPTEPEEPPPPPTKRKNPRKTRPFPESAELDALAETVGASAVGIDSKQQLDRFFHKLDGLDRTNDGLVRVLHLGDSHIAADYITRTIRERLQARFGNAGRGFVVIDQRKGYGGRRLEKKGWRRLRIVDPDGPGRAFGFSGQRLVSTRKGASAKYMLAPNDHELGIFYRSQRNSSPLKVYAEDELIAEFSTNRPAGHSVVRRVEIPEHKLGGATPPETINLVAEGTGVEIFGLSFESTDSGLIYDSIGPVGADAKVYLDLDQRSFRQHLKALAPDLVVLMIGGNDALMMRQEKRTFDAVRKQHENLVRNLRFYLPNADCLLVGPMDAGETREDGTIGSKPFLADVRDMQRAVAEQYGCAFWDTFQAMGGEGAFGRWFDKGIMNEDMVHPRAKGGDLVGHLFATALINAYLGTE